MVKVIKKKREYLNNCYSQEELKETRQLNVMWYPDWDPGIEKEH